MRVRRLERIVEQIGGVLVPQIWETLGEVVQLAPLERVQNRTPELIMGFPVPQIMEAVLPSTPREPVQSRALEQILDSPVPQIMEAVLLSTPRERVQNGTPEQIMDSRVPQIMEAVLPSTTGACAKSYAGTPDYGLPCASDLGGSR